MRIAIVGNSGSGKTTLAKRVHSRTGWRRIEIDALFHQANWQPQEPELFRQQLGEALDGEHWVCDGNYETRTDDIARRHADVIIVFDLPRHQVMRQVIRRTARRALRREELWNGNRESLSNFYRWDPEHNIIRWTWEMHAKCRAQFNEAILSGRWDHAELVTIRSHRDSDRWLRSLPERT